MKSKSDKYRFTIHFDVDAETYHILGGLAKVHKSDPNAVARDIVLAWMAEVSRSVQEPKPEPAIESIAEPKLIIP